MVQIWGVIHLVAVLVSSVYTDSTYNWRYVRFPVSTEKMNAYGYALTLYDFFNFSRADKMIAKPMRGTGLFTANDQVIMRHSPRDTFEGSGIYNFSV